MRQKVGREQVIQMRDCISKTNRFDANFVINWKEDCADLFSDHDDKTGWVRETLTYDSSERQQPVTLSKLEQQLATNHKYRRGYIFSKNVVVLPYLRKHRLPFCYAPTSRQGQRGEMCFIALSIATLISSCSTPNHIHRCSQSKDLIAGCTARKESRRVVENKRC